ncbi:putative methyltransferase-domain-containing protein [Baffinella frigidus]|nr:putative methyltransferase-domain-containing protein [Cryptophyta sp. CCMP2293]|mmetsp:Transcript_66071/g.157681  ORF Transcript_66071/g.157681 Transcript_66071/m.157681 type:complete len:221 (-) Transcript_66071:160-822(-)
MFGNTKPVKLEVCSGAGEWAVAQARADTGKANWVTLELRHDRVHQTFMRMVFAKARNLAAVHADAAAALPTLFKPGSFEAILINHPEPPQQTGGEDSQASHLLDEAFFLSMHPALAKSGVITIVTDNLWYAKLLVRIVAGINKRAKGKGAVSFKSLLPPKGTKELDDSHGVTLYQGVPGPDSGHAAEASSYFDRLWQKGISKHSHTKERFFLCIKKNAIK